MNPLGWAARLVAGAAHDVVAEFRKLDAPPPPPQEPARTEISCVCASTERRGTFDADRGAVVFGFGPGKGSGQ
jgi:hypothetical protein